LIPADTQSIAAADVQLERRQRSRQKIELPIAVRLAGDGQVYVTATTRNISSGGVCFSCPAPFVVGQVVEYVVTLAEGGAPVRISCTGHVIRCLAEGSADSGFEVALTMNRYRFVRPGDPVKRQSAV
jgi:hypothetical protein